MKLGKWYLNMETHTGICNSYILQQTEMKTFHWLNHRHQWINCTLLWRRQLLLSQIFVFVPLCSNGDVVDARCWESIWGIDLSMLWRQCQSVSTELLSALWVLLFEIGRAHVWTPVTCQNLVCRLLLEKKKKK